MITDAFIYCLVPVIFTGLGAALAIGHKNAIDLAALKAWQHEHEKKHETKGGLPNV